MFAARGVAVTTVREIGEASGILSGSLYHHFASKDAMVAEIITSYTADLAARSREARRTFPDDPEKCVRALFRASFDAMDAHRHACAIFHKDYLYVSRLPEFPVAQGDVREVTRLWHGALVQGVDQGTFRRDIDVTLFQHLTRDAICNSASWVFSGGRYGIDELADACAAVLLGGFLAPA